MKILQMIILCFSAFLFAQEEISDKKRLSFGLRLGGGIGFSIPDENVEKRFNVSEDKPYYIRIKKWENDGSGSFDAAPFLSLQLTNIFAVQTEMLFTKICYYAYGEYFKNEYPFYTDYDDYLEYTVIYRVSKPALIFPVLAKLTFNPKNISIQTFFGPHFTLDFGDIQIYKQTYYHDSKNNDITVQKYSDGFKLYNPIGLTAGGRFGVKAGCGTVFLDARYFTDLIFTNLEKHRRDVRRARLSLTLGYEFGGQ